MRNLIAFVSCMAVAVALTLVARADAVHVASASRQPCLSTVVADGDHAGLWTTNKATNETAVVCATKYSGTFVGIFSRDEAGRESLTIALTERGIVFRDGLGKQQTLTVDQLNLIRQGIAAK